MNNIAGDFEKAIKLSSKILSVTGRVLPATLQPSTLCAELETGETVIGESNISKSGSVISHLYLKPEFNRPLPEVIQAIKDAEAIILGPGSLYTSVLPNLLVKGMADAIKESKALKIYICNVMTQPGETDDFTASDHLKALFKHGGDRIVDYIILNNKTPTRLLDKYKAHGAHPVMPDIAEVKKLGVEVVATPLINETDLVRHDPSTLSEIIIKFITEKKAQSYGKYKPGERWKRWLGFLEKDSTS